MNLIVRFWLYLLFIICPWHSAWTHAEEPVLEEIVVVGTHIRRDNFDTVAPISIFDAEDIERSGALQLGEFIADAPYNYGSTDARNSLKGSQGVATSFNLRGLGAGATLNLLDGRRRIGGDVNYSIYPAIAISRIEVLRDGASAIYGTDAVTGVINIIPVKRYEGAKIQVGYDWDGEGSSNQETFSALGGFTTNSFDAVVALEYENRGNIRTTDRPEYLRAGVVDSGFGNPGNFRIPVRDAAGNIVGIRGAPDPGCATDDSLGDQGQPINNTSGFIGPFGDCRLAYGSAHDFQVAREQLTAYGNLSSEITSSVDIEIQAIYSRGRGLVRDSPSLPGGNVSMLPVIRGEHPGNPFRAVDGNGNLLFARDADNDGVADRNPIGFVILDPAGIPFNEDVLIAQWRPFGKWGTLPYGVDPDGASRIVKRGEARSLSGKLGFDIPRSSWSGYADVSHQVSESWDGTFADSTSRLIDALRGLGGPAGNEYFNPFFTTDPSEMNSQSLVDYIRLPGVHTRLEARLQTFDLVLTGDLLSLPVGPVVAAIGAQYRNLDGELEYSEARVAGDIWGTSAGTPSSISIKSSAVFGELSIPVLANLEMQVAARLENQNNGADSTNPKIGVLYKPVDSLSLRASWGTSFVAPNADQLFGPVRCGQGLVADAILGAPPLVLSVCSGGNPNLVPEEATVRNIGLTWLAMEGLTLNVDYIDIDFRNRFIATRAQDIVNLDKARLDASGMTPAAWIASGNADPRIVRDPADDSIQRVVSGASNATEMSFRGLDVSLLYLFDVMQLGNLAFRLEASYIENYTYQLLPISPRIEAAGKQNDATGAVPPLPRLKGNASLSWFRGEHAANVAINYLHGVSYDTVLAAGAPFYGKEAFAPDRLDPWVQVDVQYQLTIPSPFSSEHESTVTIGVNNLLDERAQPIFHLLGYEHLLHNVIGRQFYLRLSYEF